MNVIEPLGQVRGQAAVAIALKETPVLRPSTPSSVAIHFDAKAVRNGENLFGDAAFRWPHALGPHSKHLLVQIERAHQDCSRASSG
jgi:hypothetical protein